MRSTKPKETLNLMLLWTIFRVKVPIFEYHYDMISSLDELLLNLLSERDEPNT